MFDFFLCQSSDYLAQIRLYIVVVWICSYFRFVLNMNRSSFIAYHEDFVLRIVNIALFCKNMNPCTSQLINFLVCSLFRYIHKSVPKTIQLITIFIIDLSVGWLLINLLTVCSMICAKNSDKCQSQSPKAHGDVFKLVCCVKPTVQNLKDIFSLV